MYTLGTMQRLEKLTLVLPCHFQCLRDKQPGVWKGFQSLAQKKPFIHMEIVRVYPREDVLVNGMAEKHAWNMVRVPRDHKRLIEGLKKIADCHIRAAYFEEDGMWEIIPGIEDEELDDVIEDIRHIFEIKNTPREIKVVSQGERAASKRAPLHSPECVNIGHFLKFG